VSFALLAGLHAALAARPTAEPASAVRLFNGFYEGFPALVVDRYAQTLILHNYADPPEAGQAALAEALAFYCAQLPALRAALVKHHHSPDPAARRGVLIYGQNPDKRIVEDGVRYAIDLQLNRDCSFYLDTRPARAWLRANSAGRAVLNTFAYTGSLGVAAQAGGAARVVQLDRNRAFLSLAKESLTLNGLPIRKSDFWAEDFWRAAARLRRQNAQFEIVIVDPPFFATDHTGTVNWADEVARVLNKVRPLVADGGWLIAINNALYLSGAAYAQQLTALGADGFLALEAMLPAPLDLTGFPSTRVTAPPADPAPFNHPTKMAVLKVKRRE
jgi:23S rRNA (cytosine1962-C5)-methyltransferase